MRWERAGTYLEILNDEREDFELNVVPQEPLVPILGLGPLERERLPVLERDADLSSVVSEVHMDETIELTASHSTKPGSSHLARSAQYSDSQSFVCAPFLSLGSTTGATSSSSSSS
jgi:hypothetical protein